MARSTDWKDLDRYPPMPWEKYRAINEDGTVIGYENRPKKNATEDAYYPLGGRSHLHCVVEGYSWIAVKECINIHE